jgi:DNA-directed RNA polymerase subunit H
MGGSMTKKFEITDHILIPKHSKCSAKEKEELLQQYHIEERHLPKILKTDAAIRDLDAKSGDVIKILRKSPTAGDSIFYRVVGSE